MWFSGRFRTLLARCRFCPSMRFDMVFTVRNACAPFSSMLLSTQISYEVCVRTARRFSSENRWKIEQNQLRSDAAGGTPNFSVPGTIPLPVGHTADLAFFLRASYSRPCFYLSVLFLMQLLAARSAGTPPSRRRWCFPPAFSARVFRPRFPPGFLEGGWRRGDREGVLSAFCEFSVFFQRECQFGRHRESI